MFWGREEEGEVTWLRGQDEIRSFQSKFILSRSDQVDQCL